MEFKYDITIKESKKFQGTDLQMALRDAAAILEEVQHGKRNSVFDVNDREARLESACVAIEAIQFEVDMTRKSFLAKEAEQMAYNDAQVIEAMSANYTHRFAQLMNDQSSCLLIGTPHDPANPLPWWANLPGGAIVADWADDFGLEIREAYEEVLNEQIMDGGEPVDVGDIWVEDGCLWIRTRSER